jgi:hypothetical protein
MIIHNPILTGSFTVNGTDVSSITSSAASLTSLNAYTASQNNRNGTYATTGSNTFAGIQTVNSNLVVTGSITAQTLVVQTVTSSVVYSSGSNVFGNNIANTQVFTGSIFQSGSVASFAGAVNIGTISASPLNVNTALSILSIPNSSGIIINNSSSSSYTGFRIYNDQVSAVRALEIDYAGSSYPSALITNGIVGESAVITTTGAYPLQFGTNNALRMVLLANGNVGIGTNAPTNTLTMLASSTSTGKGIDFVNYSNVTQVLGQLTFEQVGDILALTHKLSGGGITFSTNSTERMRITSEGYLGTTVTNTTVSAGDLLGVLSFTSRDSSTYSSGGITNIRSYATTTYNTGNVSGDLRFYVSNGLQNTTGTYLFGTEAMRIFADGVMSIGMETNQYSRLAIKSNSATRYAGLNLYAPGNGNFIFLNHDNNVAWVGTEFGTGGTGATPLGFAPGGTERMRIDTSGNITLGITAAYDTAILWRQDFTGGIQARIYATGLPRIVAIAGESGGVQLTSGATSWTSNSDERLKNINGEIENALNKLLNLRAVNFSWKSDATNKENLGLIAQDVEAQFPQIVDKTELPKYGEEEQTDKTEYLGVRYTEMIPVLVKAIQELKAEIDELKNK